MTTALKYINRRFDVLALRGQQPMGEVLLSQSLHGQDSSGEICTGVQKLAQRWAMEFLTIRGSMLFLPERGTHFMLHARRGMFRSETDVRSEFNFAAVMARQNLIAEETADMHPEERFATANLLKIVISPGFLALYVEIISQAGENREVILPIDILPIRTIQ